MSKRQRRALALESASLTIWLAIATLGFFQGNVLLGVLATLAAIVKAIQIAPALR